MAVQADTAGAMKKAIGVQIHLFDLDRLPQALQQMTNDTLDRAVGRADEVKVVRMAIVVNAAAIEIEKDLVGVCCGFGTDAVI